MPSPTDLSQSRGVTETCLATNQRSRGSNPFGTTFREVRQPGQTVCFGSMMPQVRILPSRHFFSCSAWIFRSGAYICNIMKNISLHLHLFLFSPQASRKSVA